MSGFIFYKISGAFIIIVALGFTISQIGIIKIFNYPKILRSSTHVILKKYNEGGIILKCFWTCFAFSSLMLIPMSAIFYKILNTEDTPYLIVGTSFGIASGIFYVIGLMRWSFLAGDLSEKYLDKNIKPQDKKIYEMIFEAFHIYCGNSIGETMGFICMGIWISIIGVSAIKSSILPPISGFGLIIIGIGIFIGPFEWIGFKLSNKINKISMMMLMCFLIYFGVKLILI